MYYQQGDVLIKKVEKIPSSAKKVKKLTKIILARGEATGHSHRIENPTGVLVFEDTDIRYLKINQPTTVTHEEHKSITIDPGIYEIGIVREYDHFAEESRRVVD